MTSQLGSWQKARLLSESSEAGYFQRIRIDLNPGEFCMFDSRSLSYLGEGEFSPAQWTVLPNAFTGYSDIDKSLGTISTVDVAAQWDMDPVQGVHVTNLVEGSEVEGIPQQGFIKVRNLADKMYSVVIEVFSTVQNALRVYNMIQNVYQAGFDAYEIIQGAVYYYFGHVA